MSVKQSSQKFFLIVLYWGLVAWCAHRDQRTSSGAFCLFLETESFTVRGPCHVGRASGPLGLTSHVTIAGSLACGTAASF